MTEIKIRFILAVTFLSVAIGSLQAQYILTDSDVVVEDGELVSCSYAGTNIIIPSFLDGQEVTSIGDYAFESNDLISVTFPDGLISIGAYAFSDNALTSVTFPEGLVFIDYFAFRGNELTSVTFPEGLVSIGNYAFSSNDLTSVTFPEGLAYIGSNAFNSNNFDGEILTSFILPTPSLGGQWVDGNDNSYTEGEIVEDLTTTYSYQISIDHTLTDDEVVVENGKILLVALKAVYTNIIIPSTLDEQQVTSIGDEAFYDIRLTSVTLPESLISIGEWAFSDNILTSITFPEGLVSIGEEAFSGNILTSITFPEGLTSIGNYAFRYNDLTSVTFPEGLASIGDYAFSNNDLTSVTFPESLVSLDDYAFYNNDLTSVTFPESLVSLGDYAFYNNDLTSVTFPEGLVSIGNRAFASNNTLTSFSLPSPDSGGQWVDGDDIFHAEGDEVTVLTTSYDYQISADHTLTDDEVIVENGVILSVELNEFYINIIIPSILDGQQVTSIDNQVFNSKSITSVSFPESLVSIGSSAFEANHLTSVNLPEGLFSIGANAFLNNTFTSFSLPSPDSGGQWVDGDDSSHLEGDLVNNLTTSYDYQISTAHTLIDDEVIVENGVILSVALNGFYINIIIPSILDGQQITSISESAFHERSLSSVTFPEGLVSVGVNAFSSNNLQSVTLPEGLIFIGKGAFANNSITSMILPGGYTTTETQTAESWKDSNGNLHADGAEVSDFDLGYEVNYINSGVLVSVLVDGATDVSFSISGDYTDVIDDVSNFTFAGVVGNDYLITPEKTGYLFSPSELIVNDLSSTTQEIFYAYEKFDISYHNVLGENSNPKMYAKVSATIELSDLSKEGYTFDGWYQDEALTTSVTEIANGSTGDLDLYAGWEEITYEITYHDTEDAGTNPESYTISTATIELSDPSKEGYTFDGWYLNETLTTSVTEIAKGTTGDLDLYAGWEEITYEITYHNTEDVGTNPESYTISTATIELSDPSKEGYTFDGWYLDEVLTNSVTEIAKGSTGDLDLYAGWNIILGAQSESEFSAPYLYPNPVSQFLKIAGPSAAYSVINESGQIVMQGAGRELDVSHLPQGVYILQHNETTQRFIKE